MKTLLVFLILLPFLPGLLLSPDVTYPKKGLTIEAGEIFVKSTVLPMEGEEKRHHIAVALNTNRLFTDSCRPVVRDFKVVGLNEAKRLKLWTAEDDRPSHQNMIGLVTAIYETLAPEKIEVNLELFIDSGCEMAIDRNVQIVLVKKMRRWWPWNIVADMIYSV